MSATNVAGQKLRASDTYGDVLWTVTSTSATAAVGLTETAVITSPSSTYRANRAYRLSFGGLRRCNTAAARMAIAVRDTDASGTTRMGAGFHEIPANSVNFQTNWEAFVANTSASTDINSRVLAMTIVSNSGANTVLLNAGANNPYFLMCELVGLATDFPQAVAL